ncbi:MAG: DUF547 domain-containing protein [Pseudomonadales bacterium]|nr:DUF547 domain-containing protein [Pseudomonadales bacterium]
MKYALLFLCLQLNPNFADEKLADEKFATEKLWDVYDSILIRHVSSSSRQGIEVNLVDYAGFQKDPAFAGLVEALRAYPVSTLKSKNEKLAFYINAYNILTIQLILDHNPKTSIKEIGNFFSGPWDQTVLINALGELTLDDIEHRIIRPLGDPRIHFAVNCASLSCPDLRIEAYRSAVIDAQLEDQTRLFLHQKGKGAFIQGKSVFVSKLFSWYKKDFDSRGGVETFIGDYYPETKGKKLKFLDYDWALNKL